MKPQPQDPDDSQVDPAVIGNVGWVAPGILTQMANAILQNVANEMLDPRICLLVPPLRLFRDPQAKVNMNDEAVIQYLLNQS